MKPESFVLERFFAEHEFTVPHLLCCSDCEPLTKAEVLAGADADLMALWEGLSLAYTESQGHPLLCDEIAGMYAGVSSDDVLVVTPEEGIFIAMNVALGAGDHMVCTYPGYASLYNVASALGAEVSYWRPTPGQNWHFALDDLRALLRPDTRLLVINFPHNPTGALPSHREWRELDALCAERGLLLFSDEMYRGLESDPSLRLFSACEGAARSITLSGLSKTVSAPGLRLGWLVCRDAALMAELAAFKDYTTICHSAPSEILGIMVLRSRKELIARNLAHIAATSALLDQVLTAPNFCWPRPLAGSVGLVRYLGPGTAEAFCEGVRVEQGVLLAPGSALGIEGCFRVGLGRANMGEAVQRLTAYVDAHL